MESDLVELNLRSVVDTLPFNCLPTKQKYNSMSPFHSTLSDSHSSSSFLFHQHLIEHSWYAVLETFILLAAFHHDLNISFVSVITTLFVLKSFHWLASDRVDYVSELHS